MKRMTAITLIAMIVLIASAMAVAAQEVDVRGTVHNVEENPVTWTPSTFAGFYYDLKNNIGTESLTFRPSQVSGDGSSATLSDNQEADGLRDIIYKTTAQPKNFKYNPFGVYDVMGFLADRYFAAYEPTATSAVVNAGLNEGYLYTTSKNRNLMTNNQVSQVLVDDDSERTFTSSNPLVLGEGYQLAVKSIDTDGNKVYVELTKNGQVVDDAVVQPSIDNAKFSDKTYYYKTTIGATKDIIQIAIHFKNAFRGADVNIATIDGEFQISDSPLTVQTDQQYDKMSIRNIDPATKTILMDNKDNGITLSKNQDTLLMQNIYIRTADQDEISANDSLRYYIYKKYTAPGTYQIRGAVHNLSESTVTWNPSTFAGLFYDIDKNIGNESLTFRPSQVSGDMSSATLSDNTGADGLRDIIYRTTAQPAKFEYKPWGTYDAIGFLAEKYFAAYEPTATTDVINAGLNEGYLYTVSKNRNLMINNQISKVLVDDDTERTFTSATPLVLGEGYQLAVKSVDTKGNKVYVELTKNGQVVDDAVVQPSIDNAGMSDKTYYYKTTVGETTDIIQIAVHFKNAFLGADNSIATIDGEFQISDSPATVQTDQQYDKMSIRYVDPATKTIIMDNKDNGITLAKNQDTLLMQNIHILTADQNNISVSNPLRYYVYKAATIQGAAPVTPANVTAPTNVTAPVENVTPTEVTQAPVENVTPANVTPANVTPTNETAPEAPKSPGFESIFAITGLMAVAYLVLGRKQ